MEKAFLRAELTARIGALQAAGRKTWGSVPLGCPAIDRALAQGGLAQGGLAQGGGLARAGLTEIGGAEGPATAFAAFLMAKAAAHGAGRWLLWCGRSADLYLPGLRRFGLDPARLLHLRCRNDREILWAMEEGLRTPALAAVLGEVRRIDLTGARRLQLAAEKLGVMALALIPDDGEPGDAERAAPNGALTRWRVHPAPAGSGSDAVRWHVELLRVRGGSPGEWLVEWRDETGDLALAAASGERPAAALGRAAG